MVDRPRVPALGAASSLPREPLQVIDGVTRAIEVAHARALIHRCADLLEALPLLARQTSQDEAALRVETVLAPGDPLRHPLERRPGRDGAQARVAMRTLLAVQSH